MSEPTLNMAGFAADSIVDGPGLRCVVFAQGCPHHCPGCHNPETQPFAGGRQVAAAELFARIRANPLCRAVTFSGDEPFAQPEALSALAALLKSAGYELAAYTGYTFEELLAGTDGQKKLLSQLDTLIDGRYVQSRRSLSLRFRGSDNQRILNVQKSMAAGAAVPETAVRWTGGTI